MRTKVRMIETATLRPSKPKGRALSMYRSDSRPDTLFVKCQHKVFLAFQKALSDGRFFILYRLNIPLLVVATISGPDAHVSADLRGGTSGI